MPWFSRYRQKLIFLLKFSVNFDFELLKVPGPISQDGDMMHHHPRNLGFKFQLSWLNPLDTRKDYIFCNCLYLYCVNLIMVTITSHIVINIFQTVQFSAVIFTRGNEKNMSFLLIPKCHKVWKKIEVIRPGSFSLCLIDCNIACCCWNFWTWCLVLCT